jgi:organic hydroperoxide reductase OsmC/OhrA
VSDHCAECSFTYDLPQAAAAGADIRERVADVVAILHNTEVAVRSRPRPGVWSPLEYGCHLRDVLLVQRERVLAARRASRAECVAMGRDERVECDGYNEQDPADVARQLTDAAMLFSNVLARLGADDWDRTVIYNYPEANERTLRWLAVHIAHDAQHHLLDIRRQVQAALERRQMRRQHTYQVRCTWQGSTAVGYREYQREHVVTAPPARDSLTLSADPAFLGQVERLNPEQLVVMAAASCQLLSFLAVAARAHIDVLSYEDDAVGIMTEDDQPIRLTRIVLQPRIIVAPGATAQQVRRLIEVAHDECYVANSLRTEVAVQPQVEIMGRRPGNP